MMCVNALQRAYIISTIGYDWAEAQTKKSVNALQRAYIISTSTHNQDHEYMCGVNALQRAYIISTPGREFTGWGLNGRCQCPSTGLHHFYPALLEAPVYKALRGAFSPRFF